MNLPRIFIAIAAYRDPELQYTLQNLFARATHPERVFVGVCWQYVPGDDDWHFSVPYPQDQVRVRAYHARDSQGACWARSIAHGLREGEEYVLQLDSHMRVHEGWDDTLIDMLRACGSDRPVLSAYPAAYDPPDALYCGTYALVATKFDTSGVLNLEGRAIHAPLPVPVPWLAGGLIFAPSDMFDETPYDPALYFIGEEVTFSARAWTRGWDFFAPNQCVVHHYYTRPTASKHWRDHGQWVRRNERSVRRVRHLLGTEPSGFPTVTEGLDGPMGLGSARSLAQYQTFAGVDFSRRKINHERLASVLGPGLQHHVVQQGR